MTHALVREVRAALKAAADPVKAPQMQAYMKSSMPYRGVDSTRQKRIWRQTFAAHPPSSAAQSRFKSETDLDLLHACIEPNLEDRNFFIRKAIGWALRQYAWTDPKEIARYVRANRLRLSPLGIREALKNL
jgi:3-methyladenine DNA glycosylase AlkD